MRILKSSMSKAMALVLVGAVLPIYQGVGFALAATHKAADAAVNTAALQDVQGRLTTAGNNAITVNGNAAKTGETIFSGQQIQTPSGTSATVQLGGVGRVEIAPGSNVTLTFGAGSISVVLTSGCVKLTANPGVAGTVESGGKTQTTDTEKGGVIDTCPDRAPAAVATIPAATVGAGGGLGTGAAVAITGAVLATFSAISNRVISDSTNPEPLPCTPIPGNTSPATPSIGCT
jgi:hypothetical protein